MCERVCHSKPAQHSRNKRTVNQLSVSVKNLMFKIVLFFLRFYVISDSTLKSASVSTPQKILSCFYDGKIYASRTPKALFNPSASSHPVNRQLKLSSSISSLTRTLHHRSYLSSTSSSASFVQSCRPRYLPRPSYDPFQLLPPLQPAF